MTRGPGSLLTRIISDVTGETGTAQCRCVERRRAMNSWGWVGCWRRRRQIVGWIVEEARRRGHDVRGNHVLQLLKAAVREALSRRQSVQAAFRPPRRGMFGAGE